MTEEQLAKMKAGRDRAKAARDAGAVKRVAVFAAWSKADAAVSAQRAAGVPTAREPMPPLPSKLDYQIVSGEAAEDE